MESKEGNRDRQGDRAGAEIDLYPELREQVSQGQRQEIVVFEIAEDEKVQDDGDVMPPPRPRPFDHSEQQAAMKLPVS